MKHLCTGTYPILLLILCACGSISDTSQISGNEYEVVVVMNNIAWDGTSGSLIREQFSAPVPYLKRNEPSIDVRYVIPEQVDDSIKYAGNILIVNIDKIEYPSVQYKNKTRTGKWPDEPAVVYLNVPDEQSLEIFLNSNSLLEKFTHEAMEKIKFRLAKTHSSKVLEMVKKHFDISLHAPEDIVSCKESTDCVWFSNSFTNHAPVGRTDLLVFSFPYEDRESLSYRNITDKIDSVAKVMVPGSEQGTYMAINRNGINYTTTTLRGKYCAIVHGEWHLRGNESVSGPFVCYARADEANNRIIVAEGFIYEPVKKNRDYIKNVEVALQTLRFADEKDEN